MLVGSLEGSDPLLPIPVSAEEIAVDSFMAEGDCGCFSRRDSPPDIPSSDAWVESSIDDAEFDWMLARRPLKDFSPTSLALDYGESEATRILSTLDAAGLAHLAPALHWPGVGTRADAFIAFCARVWDGAAEEPTADSALRAFGRSLGRVTTYRALALDEAALRAILEADCIFPSGQLRVGADVLAQVVNEKGVRCVCVARLYISFLRRLLGHDPSISLHDDWQTTSVIASGYADIAGSAQSRDPSRCKRVHLFEVSVPVVESCGWSLHDVAIRAPDVLGERAPRHERWFRFDAPAAPGGVWFDSALQGTERYGLYGVPFLRKRLRRLVVFGDTAELTEAVTPFVERHDEVHALWQQGAAAEEVGGEAGLTTTFEKD